MLKAIRSVLLPLVLFVAGPAIAADNIYVSPGFFGMNQVSRVRRPVFAALESHWGGSWSFVASCRPAAPTNPADPCYNWGNLDLGLAFAKANGYRLQYNLGYAPTWSNGGLGTQNPPLNLQDYSDWVTAYSSRYGKKTPADAGVEALTVWNEAQDKANGTGFNGSLPTLLALEQIACNVVHSVAPSTLVLSPSTYGAAGLIYHANYFAAGGGQCVDAFSWHSYPVGDPNNLEQWDNTTNFYKALLGLYGRTSKPTYVTEGGCANCTTDPYAEGSLWPLFMACMPVTNAQPYAWDRPPGGNTSLDYWLGANYPNDANGRGVGYRTMQAWLIGATIKDCPARQANTNMVRNPSGAGFTAGTLGAGGALGTNWSYNANDNAYGVQAAVVGSCSNGGATGVALRIYTPTAVQSGASGSMTFAFESNGQVNVGVGKQLNVGATVALTAGSMNGLNAFFAYNEYTTGNGFLNSTMGATNAPVVPISAPVTWNWKATVASLTAAYEIPKFGFSYVVGASFDATVCISSASADTGSIWTASITRPGGYSALIAWDSLGGPTLYSVPSTYPYQRDATNALGPVANGSSVLMQAPRLFESAPMGGFAVVDRPQFPHLLDSYANKPSWQVAGVNYYVGVPSNIVLKDPMTLIGNQHFTVGTSNKMVYIDDPNQTLDGYDLRGWSVFIRASNATVRNCWLSAVPGKTDTPIFGYAPADGSILIEHNTIDGASQDINALILIASNVVGDPLGLHATIRYNWLRNAGDDMIQFQPTGPGSVTIDHNLIENGGMVYGAHGDFLQFIGQGISASVLYNTSMQSAAGTSQGWMMEPDVGQTLGVITGGEIGYNTMVGANSAFTGVTVADLTGSLTVHDNYFDPTNSLFGLAFGGVRGGPNDGNAFSAFVHNVNMTNGALAQDSPLGAP